ncbi:hypothetical protein FN846DRAFT_1021154 [Sphaerosporella brunnea]|uniref:Rhodopsin domain-containing protein n=1 Tax=Sphaerosporella brunnea TaxID=1250544 RepID=A0A5J5EYV4_9PEZI|nr:hypothetical protein FN846DRAFT_1021154 [Sphaerosporella brunnea]
MGLDGKVVVIVKLTTDFAAVCCCILRWYILRKQTRNTTGNLLSHFLLAFSILCEITATIQSTTVLLAGDRYIKEHGIAAGQLYLLNEQVLKVTFFAHLFYYLAECVLKAAYLAFYADLYSRIQTKRRLAIWIATSIWASSYVSAFLLLFTYCSPFERNWKPDGKDPRCPVLFNVTAFFVLAGANILSDIAILVVPLLIIGAMRLGRTEKISLVLVFSIGMMSIAASVFRAGIVGHRFITANHTWDTVWVWMLWSHAEMFFGVLAFTLPSFRYIFLRGMNKVAATSRQLGYGSRISATRSRNKSQKLQSTVELESTSSKSPGRDGVLVQTTVTLKEESRAHMFQSESQTDLTGVDDARQRAVPYEWRIDSAERSPL